MQYKSGVERLKQPKIRPIAVDSSNFSQLSELYSSCAPDTSFVVINGRPVGISRLILGLADYHQTHRNEQTNALLGIKAKALRDPAFVQYLNATTAFVSLEIDSYFRRTNRLISDDTERRLSGKGTPSARSRTLGQEISLAEVVLAARQQIPSKYVKQPGFAEFGLSERSIKSAYRTLDQSYQAGTLDDLSSSTQLGTLGWSDSPERRRARLVMAADELVAREVTFGPDSIGKGDMLSVKQNRVARAFRRFGSAIKSPRSIGVLVGAGVCAAISLVVSPVAVVSVAVVLASRYLLSSFRVAPKEVQVDLRKTYQRPSLDDQAKRFSPVGTIELEREVKQQPASIETPGQTAAQQLVSSIQQSLTKALGRELRPFETSAISTSAWSQLATENVVTTSGIAERLAERGTTLYVRLAKLVDPTVGSVVMVPAQSLAQLDSLPAAYMPTVDTGGEYEPISNEVLFRIEQAVAEVVRAEYNERQQLWGEFKDDELLQNVQKALEDSYDRPLAPFEIAAICNAARAQGPGFTDKDIAERLFSKGAMHFKDLGKRIDPHVNDVTPNLQAGQQQLRSPGPEIDF